MRNIGYYSDKNNCKLCRRMALLITAVLMIVLLCGCSKEEHRMFLDLDSNPESGFEWEVTQADELFEVSREYVPAKSGSKQDGGKDHFILTPIEPGFTSVTFTYKNAKKKSDKNQEQGAEYAYTIIVDESLQISVVSSTGSMGGSELGSKYIPVPSVQ